MENNGINKPYVKVEQKFCKKEKEVKTKFSSLKDCQMVAKKFNIRFVFNENFPINTLALMRGALVIDENKKKNILIIFLMHIGYQT